MTTLLFNEYLKALDRMTAIQLERLEIEVRERRLQWQDDDSPEAECGYGVCWA